MDYLQSVAAASPDAAEYLPLLQTAQADLAFSVFPYVPAVQSSQSEASSCPGEALNFCDGGISYRGGS